MTVFEVKGRVAEVGPGVAGSEAEAAVTTTDGKDMLVYACCFEGNFNYVVSEKSLYGTMGGDDEPCAEQYQELNETKKSAYHRVFAVLDKILRLTEG